LAEAKEIKPGPGILVFCGTGFPWHLSNLEDFVDFYRVGTHRQDDPFALMELHHIEHEKLSLLRNIDHFAFLKRAIEQGKITSFEWPVHGPKFGGPIAPPKVANEMPMAGDNLPADPVRPPHVSVRRRKKATSKKAPKGFAKKAAKKTMKKLSKKTAKTSSAKKRSAKAWKPTAGRKAVATKKTAKKKKKARKSRRW
jgi:hypothetical protein